METQCCLLPGGYIGEDGVRHREIELRALTGREEEMLASREAQSSAALVSGIIERCLVRIGDIRGVSQEMARRLLVADRQFIILKLRELTFGDRVRTTVKCLAPGCGCSIDVDFSLHDIPVKELAEMGPSYSVKLSPEAALETAEGKIYRDVMFRLPNGGDQEIVSPLLRSNEAHALSLLLERCVLGIGLLVPPPEELVAMLSPMARLEIEKAMEDAAPGLDLTMAGACPECRREFEIPFELQEMFFGEFRPGLDLLYREVHSLAYHYHWSEREIMEMTRQKRERYIDILTAELEGMNDGV